MTQDTDKIWRNQLDEASPDELMDNFDEGAIWKKIQPQFVPKKNPKNATLLGYWPYAAMLAIGLFLGFYFKGNTSKEIVAAQKIISKQMVRDTVFIEKTAAQNTASIALRSNKKLVAPKTEMKTIAEPKGALQKALVQNSLVEPPSAFEENPVAKAEQKEIAVVYFDDLKRNDKAIFVASEKKNRKKFFSIKKPQSSETTMEELPVRNLLYAINK